MSLRHLAAVSCLSLLTFSSRAARAWEPVPERPATPSLSAAGTDGAWSLWRNPANLAFDRDRSYAVLYSQQLDEGAESTLAAVRNFGPLGLGGAYKTSPGGENWWTVSTGLGLKLGQHFTVGTHLGFQVLEGRNNFTTWDMGLGWRPLSWLGFAGLAQNIGSPAPGLGVEERYGGGVVLRPLGDRVLLGADYLFTGIFEDDTGEGVPTPDPEGLLELTLRAQVIEGLIVRAYGNQEGTVGGGLEFYLGRHGGGAQAQASLDGSQAPQALIYAASSQDGERLLGSGEQVAGFVLDEAYPYQPQTGLFGTRSGESYIRLLDRMHRAATDPSVKGLFLHIERASFSLAQIEEIRGVIADARGRGKTVVVYMDRATSNGAYMLAAAADRVYLHPAADLNLVGLSAELQFFAGALDLIGVEAQYAKRAEYKSGPERFTNTEASPANREQMNALLDGLFEHLVASVAEGRGRTPEQIRAMIDEGPFTAEQAKARGLVDDLLYPDQIEKTLDDVVGRRHRLDIGYGRAGEMSGWRAPNEIAVIYVAGGIVTGESSAPSLLGGGRQAGSETIVRQLDRARRDSSVKAVVLRVDSPGGSAFASDEIWRAVERVKRSDKPVIVSMGGTAASGGYYVAAGATAIYALPSTVTGSIGVYSGKFSLSTLYDRVGVGVEQYTRGRNAAMFSLSTPLDDSEYAALDRMAASTYDQFKDRVGKGRRMSDEQVEEVARGRVWTGEAAKENGLVDELGGFHDAVARAREEAGIRPRAEVALLTYPDQGSAGELSRATVQAMTRRAVAEVWPGAPLLPPEAATVLEQWRQLQTETVWAVMPYHLEIH